MQMTKPSNQQVRDYMAKRREERTPPPSIEEIRRHLGWYLKADAHK
jgi:hypothetical protein